MTDPVERGASKRNVRNCILSSRTGRSGFGQFPPLNYLKRMSRGQRRKSVARCIVVMESARKDRRKG
jgi:hypothetical protein